MDEIERLVKSPNLFPLNIFLLALYKHIIHKLKQIPKTCPPPIGIKTLILMNFFKIVYNNAREYLIFLYNY